ncbi:MAG TPA: hypothetical protein VMT87_11435, partial [Vicinamibacteria bacterium]|nr:hypothetical protein [Vicinamibacteria bacterium]
MSMSARRNRLAVLVAMLGAALSTGCGGGLFSASDSPATLHGTITGVPVASRASASAEASAAAAAVTVTLEQDP